MILIDIMMVLFLFLLVIIVPAADAFTQTSRYHHHPVSRNRATKKLHQTSATENYEEGTQTQIPRISTSKRSATIEGPPIESKPDYSSIYGPLGPFLDTILMSLFRFKLAQRLSRSDNEIIIPDSKLPLNDFMGIIDLTSRMNAQHSNRKTVQTYAQEVLVSLFPTFILDRYPSWFAKPFPEFSAKMCAWATVVGGTWLMGECEVNDIPEMDDENGGGKGMGVLVKRCRFLEESQCASICVNSCKIPTQNFFYENMGLPLTMTPDYNTGECQFAFGKLPTAEEERAAKDTPCLMRCPSNGGMRSWHNSNEQQPTGSESGQWIEDLKALGELQEMPNGSVSSCSLMED
jgi:hypothetical protein